MLTFNLEPPIRTVDQLLTTELICRVYRYTYISRIIGLMACVQIVSDWSNEQYYAITESLIQIMTRPLCNNAFYPSERTLNQCCFNFEPVDDLTIIKPPWIHLPPQGPLLPTSQTVCDVGRSGPCGGRCIDPTSLGMGCAVLLCKAKMQYLCTCKDPPPPQPLDYLQCGDRL